MRESKVITGAASDASFSVLSGKPSIDLIPDVSNAVRSSTSSSTTGTMPAVFPPARKAASPSKKGGDERAYRQFRHLMDDLVDELDKAPDYIEDDKLSEEGSAVTTEVEEVLRRLSDCQWGEGESLKLVVTVLLIPIRNARWTRKHVEFLQEAARLIRVQYLIDASTVKMCKDILKAHGLDIFRGSVTEPQVLRSYKIVEVNANE